MPFSTISQIQTQVRRYRTTIQHFIDFLNHRKSHHNNPIPRKSSWSETGYRYSVLTYFINCAHWDSLLVMFSACGLLLPGMTLDVTHSCLLYFKRALQFRISTSAELAFYYHLNLLQTNKLPTI
jgi:hypothetical protein